MLRLIWQGIRACVRSGLAFAVWGLWLALVLLLAAQLFVLSRRQLEVPAFVLRELESRLTASGVRLTFGASSFDPTGWILVENVEGRLDPFQDPVFTARAITGRFNPWMAIVGRFEPTALQVVDATVSVPAMLSPSGRTERIVTDFDVVVEPGDRQYVVPQLTARIAGVVLTAHGILPAPGLSSRETPDFPNWISRHFPDLCRQAITAREYLADFEAPSLHVIASSSEPGVLDLEMRVLARAAQLRVPASVSARDVQLATRVRLPTQESESRFEFTASEIRLPFDTTAQRVRALAIGTLPARGNARFEPRQFDVTAVSVSSQGFSADTVSAHLNPPAPGWLDGAVVAHIAGLPLAVQAGVNFTARTAELQFAGSISPDLLSPVSERLGVDLRRFFEFGVLDLEDGTARLGPGWKLEQLAAQATGQEINAYGVRIDRGRATLRLDGRRFRAPEVHAIIGENSARGSYEQDLSTREFRFLLDGQLRPLEISGWFRPWWPNFFRQFEFPEAPPVASVDVTGVWREGLRTAVFVFVTAREPVIRGVRFDDLLSRLFIRPGIFDGLEVIAHRDGGRIEGTFGHTVDLEARQWRTLDLSLKSTLALEVATRILGPLGERLFNAYTMSAPPRVQLQAHFDGPASPTGRHQSIDADVQTTGEFRFHRFPFQDPSFDLKVRDDEILIEDLEARFAGGVVTGQTRVWNSERGRRVHFDLVVKDASLGQATATLQNFFAERRGTAMPTPGKFVQEKANVRLDMIGAAEGAVGDPLSYVGAGDVSLRGAEIGAVPLLGSLSELLSFTALRFTEAHGSFNLNGPKVEFPVLTFAGANSAIEARGAYALDARQLDFRVKVFPFQESSNLVKSVVGAVLSPLSNALEVKLTGSLEKPEWGFLLLSAPALEPDGFPALPAGNGTGLPQGLPTAPSAPVQPLAIPEKNGG